MNKLQIKIVSRYIGGGLLLGGACWFFMLLLVHRLVLDSWGLSHWGNLLEQYDFLYLSHLIPFVGMCLGGILGYRLSNRFFEVRNILHSQTSVVEKCADFAREIGKGNYHYKFSPKDDHDTLGRALVETRSRLIEAKGEEQDRQKIMVIVGEVRRLVSENIEEETLSKVVLDYLVTRLKGVVQGAFYIVRDPDDLSSALDMVACNAYSKEKVHRQHFRVGQGLVGQAVLEGAIIHRTEIPSDYATITSGLLGDDRPASLMFVPLVFNGLSYGVIELAGDKPFSELQLQIVKEISEMIARALYNIRVSQRTYELLRESQNLSHKLSHQKVQLEMNAKEMIQTQNELRHSNKKLEEKIHEVDRSQKTIQILLENASEVIQIVDSQGVVSYVSPSIKHILGYQVVEIEGFSKMDNVHPQDVSAFEAFLKEIVSFPEQEHRQRYRYFTKSGHVTWLECIGKNFLEDPVLNGILLNIRDVSMQIKAEDEQRRSAKMQALSENSPDLIARIDVFGKCTYINPIVENYTGKKTVDFIGNNLSDLEIDPAVREYWNQELNIIIKTQEKRLGEMTFKGPQGVVHMKVNAMPEHFEDGKIESVLFVCNDITEARKREDIIRLKNKNINDSMNYAYNIQSSIMPSEEQIRKNLPNSFMFYKPKDAVSGDYPWLSQHGDDIFIGAMDCTGHGVPGALMSLIGYFAQSEILLENPTLDAAGVLDSLHRHVVKTLRQDKEDSKTKDGMDAAFCKVNLKKSELHFAGAHRPLFLIRDGEFNEIKGDRYPIGGTHYKRRSPFTNHQINLQKGDAIYLFSDGFPDQFGGQDGKHKYMIGTMKKLVADNTHLSIFQMGELFKKTFYDWKGETSQVDDVLIIGIKF